MFEYILSYLWPDSWREKIVAILVLASFVAGCFDSTQQIGLLALSGIYHVLPVAVIVIWLLLLVIGQREKAFLVDELTDPLFFYGIVFSGVYWWLGCSDTLIWGFVPVSARFAFGMSILVVTGGNHFLLVRTWGLKRLAESERPSRSVLPRASTLPYFAHIIGEMALLFFSFVIIALLAVKMLRTGFNMGTVHAIAMALSISLCTIFLSIHRTESLFWSLFVLFCAGWLFVAVGGATEFEIGFIGLQIFWFLLFGLSTVYNIESPRQHLALVSVALCLLLIQRVFESVELFGLGPLRQLLSLFVVPLSVALLAGYLASRWSLQNARASSDFLSVDEVANVMKVSSATVYKVLRSGNLRGAKVGRQWRIRRTWMNAYVGGQGGDSGHDTTEQVQ